MSAESQNVNTTPHPDPETHWKHRRRIAYASLLGVVVLGACGALGATPEESLPLAQSAIWALASMTGLYVGGACAVEAVAKLRRP